MEAPHSHELIDTVYKADPLLAVGQLCSAFLFQNLPPLDSAKPKLYLRLYPCSVLSLLSPAVFSPLQVLPGGHFLINHFHKNICLRSCF